MDDDFLLRLYRLARESRRSEFQAAAIGLLRKSIDFESAFWGDGEVKAGSTGAILTSAYFDAFDPNYVSDWRALHHRGRLIPVAANDPGRALEVRSAQFYSREPARAELHEKYRLRSYSFISDFAPDGVRCNWLNLYRSDADASGARDVLTRLEWVMPHLGEAWRIHRAIHFADDAHRSRSGQSLASPNRQMGGVLRADAELRVTDRQREIASLYARGWSHKEVAGAFALSPATVRNHLAAVYAALQVHSRRDLCRALEVERN